MTLELSIEGAMRKPEVKLLRMSVLEWIGWIVVFAIVVASILLFTQLVNPSLNGDNNLRIGADSAFYLWLSGMVNHNPYGSDSDISPLLSIGTNFLGPQLIGSTLRDNFLIVCFNYFLFFTTLWLFAKSRSISVPYLAIALLLNPAILVSVLTLNKEIIVIFSTALLCYYSARHRDSTLLLLLLLSVALLGRWQHLLLVVVFLMFTAKSSPFSKHRKLALACVLIGITLVYPFIASFVNISLGSEELIGNTIAKLTSLQSSFLYFLVFLPKLAFNLYGGVIGIPAWFSGVDLSDVYNRIIVPSSAITNLLLTGAVLLFRSFRFDLKDDMFFFLLLYALIFSMSPFVQGRYMLPVYVILCLELCIRREETSASISSPLQ